MYTIKDFIDKKIAVCLPRGKERNRFLQACEKECIIWADGNFPSVEHYDVDDIIYVLTGYDGYGKYRLFNFTNRDYLESKGFEIVSIKEFAL